MEIWKISNKVTAIVSDNVNNIVAAVQSGGWRHIGCFAHTLNLVVQEMQKQMNLPVLKLKQDVVTRWNSTYDMLNRVVSRKDAVIATLALVRHELALNTTEWQVVEEAIPILKSFYEVTTEISTEKQRFRDVNKYERAVSGLKKKVGLSSRINVRTENSESRSTAQPRPEAVGEPSNSSASIWQKFDEEVSALVPCNPVAAGIVELDKYIQEPLLAQAYCVTLKRYYYSSVIASARVSPALAAGETLKPA
ncbi:Zinc finger BED domain-containing protein 6 [Eumeta japonica]|uniref:Zinc finger BED domain-containing protein 6 n=1 Tax=Eumeta variegata TaxID=151549 RepID=A0A4C1T5P1_EUMVA|nr:Zinc finger BED domain-containing protein 6 [Eumeta japonica]